MHIRITWRADKGPPGPSQAPQVLIESVDSIVPPELGATIPFKLLPPEGVLSRWELPAPAQTQLFCFNPGRKSNSFGQLPLKGPDLATELHLVHGPLLPVLDLSVVHPNTQL